MIRGHILFFHGNFDQQIKLINYLNLIIWLITSLTRAVTVH